MCRLPRALDLMYAEGSTVNIRKYMTMQWIGLKVKVNTKWMAVLDVACLNAYERLYSSVDLAKIQLGFEEIDVATLPPDIQERIKDSFDD